MRTSSVILAIAVLGAAAGTAGAQGRGRGRNNDNVPPGQRPPAGMCRIWIDGVPPGHQPAPTDCQTAVRNQPPNSRIIWGDNTGRRDRTVYDDAATIDAIVMANTPTTRTAICTTRTASTTIATAGATTTRKSTLAFGHAITRTTNQPGSHGGDPGNNGGGTIDRGQYPSQNAGDDGRVADPRWRSHGGRSELARARLAALGDRGRERRRRSRGCDVVRQQRQRFVQVWRDENRDGRADYVEIYRNGQRVRSFGRNWGGVRSQNFILANANVLEG